MENVHPSKFFALFKKTSILTLYFAIWFCTLNFYNEVVLHAGDRPHVTYAYSIFLAGILAKFIIMGQQIAPLKVMEGTSLFWMIIRRTTIDTMIALFLRYIFAGIEGLFNHQGFFDSMRSFGGGDWMHILAIWMVFWLVIMPYMIYCALCNALGPEKIHAIFVSNKLNTLVQR